MRNMIYTVILAAVGSNALFAFIQFLVTRHDTKKKDEKNDAGKEITNKLMTLEKDTLRTQLLLLILLKPEEKQEIMTVAEHYFKVLHGNWYMTSIFNKWLEDTGTAEPEWFDKNS